jgi:hypothetical protein
MQLRVEQMKKMTKNILCGDLILIFLNCYNLASDGIYVMGTYIKSVEHIKP